jgi:hypothetical protein
MSKQLVGRTTTGRVEMSGKERRKEEKERKE